MSDDQINIAIAEWCGWGAVQDIGRQDKHAMGFPPGCNTRAEFIPSYSTDLNAMHEAEKKLTEDEWKSYLVTLNKTACRLHGCGNTGMCAYTVAATARQRAEALLRTVGKWKE